MEFTDFNKVEVQAPNFEQLAKDYQALTAEINNADDALQAIDVVSKYFVLSDKIATDYNIIYIRHTIDTRNETYNHLSDEYDQNLPVLSEYENNFSKAMLNSKFRKELEAKFGKLMFDKIELGLKVFSPEIIPDLQEENSLIADYNRLVGNAKAKFRGEDLQITKFSPYLTNLDRETRKEASQAFWKYYEDNDEKLGEIYSKLVIVRDRLAHKLGFENFIPVAYYRLGRTDFDQHDVANYRQEVLTNIVPICQKLYKDQAKRIGIPDMKYYDYALDFKTGNSKPKGTPEELVAKARKMYEQMNPTASKYFNFMVDHNVMDLVAKEGKVPGGYMTFIPDLHTSYIFSNFNGSNGDVDVLTHEFGHSLQGFLSADITVPALRSPGYETCEMHSMSMEFLAYPWMNLFFGDEAQKYCYSHLEGDIEFIPYGVSVDEFQHFVYENPTCTHAERKAKWREIEKKYTPHKHYGEDNPYLESGAFWIKQHHIFENPFYYIDYTIAQVAAFEFFVESLHDFNKTMDKYINFCKLGGTLPYKQLMKASGIKDPMVKGTIASITPDLQAYLDAIDTSKL